MSLTGIVVGAVFINNFILARFLGMCPFMGISRSSRPALAMGATVTGVMALTVAITWPLYNRMLLPLNLEYLQVVVFVLVIAALVQGLEILLKRSFPAVYQSFGIYLPLMTTNCAIMGVALLGVSEGYSYSQSIVFAAASGAGFALALVLMSAMRERLEMGSVPRPFAGLAIAFITAAMLSMAFSAFSALNLG